MRTGTTLLEAILAILLLEFAFLALLGGTAVATRDLVLVQRRIQARAIARDRVERLRATACVSASSGATQWRDGIEEIWRVEARGPARVAVDSVVAPLPRGREIILVERAWSLCQ